LRAAAFILGGEATSYFVGDCFGRKNIALATTYTTKEQL